ncbi:inositol-pentakisphosphate 2-kinase isoform X3 [Hypanus sabinus]|uniref:inositol-pentakisphosphate 2-kinase isoform X3 n=1 Tax=Hypanus sabinus TaxID=79690 RepID=UPI0028C40AC4|nr:inositol-pentakisphosphate 2-kinase isoform X3 [Hypanus sabinus]
MWVPGAAEGGEWTAGKTIPRRCSDPTCRTEVMELKEPDGNEWKYHGEGNRSLVVSHVQHCQVLRFLKFPIELPQPNKALEEVPHRLNNIVEFSKHVMKPLLGDNFVQPGEVIQLPLDFVRQLALKIQQERPGSRCNKVMDVFSGYTLCLPDLTKFQTSHHIEKRPPLCIEIKPKCGFIPFSSHITKEIKRRVCRYCMHQHLKVANGKWKKMSKYCPLDLFSGNKQRMCIALKSLLQEPQNNLKIFKNGELIFGCKDDQDCLMDLNELANHLKAYFFPTNGVVNGPQCIRTVITELIQVITMALLSTPADSCRTGDMKRTRISEEMSQCEASQFRRDVLRNNIHSVENSGLPNGSVLSQILQVQMLDMMDIDGIYPLYLRVQQHLEEFPKDRSRLHLDGPYDESFYESLSDFSQDDETVDYAARKIHQYRVATTAKDCSIMIALSPCLLEERPEPSSIIRTSRTSFAYSISILDLDPKPYENIAHQYKLDGKIINYYLQNTRTKKDVTNPNVYRGYEECTLFFHSVTNKRVRRYAS